MKSRWAARGEAVAIVTLLLMLSGLRALPVAAQAGGLVNDSAYVFGMTGTQVSWSGPWTYDEEGFYQDQTIEFVSLYAPEGGVLLGYVNPLLSNDLDGMLELVLDGFSAGTDAFATIDRSQTNGVSYSLDVALIEGDVIGVFTFMLNDASTGHISFASLLAPAVDFAAGVASAQANIVLNGSPAFAGVDPAGLQGHLDAAAAEANAGAEDPEQDEADDDDPPTRPDDEDEDQGEEDQDRGDADNAEIDPELAELGFVEEGLYESPQYGIEVEFSDDWTLDPELLTSDEDEGRDALGFRVGDGEGLLVITFFPSEGIAPADFAAFWTSDDFLAENASEDAEILLEDSTRSESGVLMSDVQEDGTPILTLRQAYSLNGGDTIAVVTLIGLEELFPDALADAQDGLEVDGEPALSLFTVDDIEDVL